jgi:hypothetical protein
LVSVTGSSVVVGLSVAEDDGSGNVVVVVVVVVVMVVVLFAEAEGGATFFEKSVSQVSLSLSESSILGPSILECIFFTPLIVETGEEGELFGSSKHRIVLGKMNSSRAAKIVHIQRVIKWEDPWISCELFYEPGAQIYDEMFEVVYFGKRTHFFLWISKFKLFSLSGYTKPGRLF